MGSSWLCLHTSRDGDLTTSGAAPRASSLFTDQEIQTPLLSTLPLSRWLLEILDML